jgi:aspartate kinase
MKFGGTSVATSEGRAAIAARVREALDGHHAPVVVVSAMGRAGAPYATDTLLSLVGDLPGDTRERDLLASVGEVVSAVVVAHELRGAGIDASALTGGEAGILTDGVHDGASITEVRPDTLHGLIDAAIVPVVCGFQGLSPDGVLTTLGRGGSDTTACALGVALGALKVEIYTDVDGVMTTDPRTCADARVLEVIGADELFQMARAGSKVVHSPAAELALASGIPLTVKNTFRNLPGTRVVDIDSYRPDSVATSVTAVPDVARVRVRLPSHEGTDAHMAAQAVVYRLLADAGVSLDMFTPMNEYLVFTVCADEARSVRFELGESGFDVDVTEGLAKVTLVGAGMHGVPGVMARLVECLAESGVTVWQTADSHTTISVLVPQADADLAVAALHAGFDLAG